MFKHNQIIFPKLRQNNGGPLGRTYSTPHGDFPSITNVLGRTGDKSGLHAWRKRVGAVEAQRVMETAAARGTVMHSHCEDYLNNKDIVLSENTSGNILFENIKPFLNKMSNIRALESQVFSKYLGAAGTVDCCADYDGVPSVIDFKSSNKEKRKDWITDYFLQGAFYTTSIFELSGLKCEQIVIIISPEEGNVQEFVIKGNDIVPYIKQAKNRIDLFKSNMLDSQKG